MFLAIGNVLDRFTLEAITAAIRNDLEFEDGRATAGAMAREVKHNRQAAPGEAREAVFARITQSLLANEMFVSAVRPKDFAGMVLSRCEAGMSYGSHIDNTLMGGRRADVSFTLFLSPSDAYEGGELVLEDTLEDRSIRLEAGEAFVYPSNTLHRVEPVVRGERVVVAGWVQSWVRDPAKREILFDLDQVLAEEQEARNGSNNVRLLAKTRGNLLRMWAED